MRYGLHARKLSPHCNTLRESRCWLVRAGFLSTRETNQPGGILVRKPSIDQQAGHALTPQYPVSSPPKILPRNRKENGRGNRGNQCIVLSRGRTGAQEHASRSFFHVCSDLSPLRVRQRCLVAHPDGKQLLSSRAASSNRHVCSAE